MTMVLYAAAAILGFAWGSFLNVVIHRLPHGTSVVRPRSFCPSCRRTIPWYENIPILSYILLRGRCRGCGSRISIRYIIVELIGGALCVFCIHRYGLSAEAVAAYVFLMALLAVTLIDWKHRIIPDEISLSFILIGLLWSFFNPAVSPVSSALGAIAGGGSLYVVGALYKLARHTEGMGGGDVKLMAMIGAFLGIGLVLPVIVIASFFGSVYGIALLRSGKGRQAAVAFGSFLAPAAAVCLIYGEAILGWYFGRF
jgi:leader peptidase (prepilin peptidase)/N-methyltransferase